MQNTCVAVYIYMSNMDLITYIMSTMSISILGQIQGTQHNTLLVSVVICFEAEFIYNYMIVVTLGVHLVLIL